MGNTLTNRLPEELPERLREKSRITALPAGGWIVFQNAGILPPGQVFPLFR
jgi:hypothetical protein